MKRWWMRWYGLPADSFEYHGPWWGSGYALVGDGDVDDVPIFVAAVVAPTEEAAKRIIENSYDDGPSGVLEWSFANERPADWDPFCDRFPRAKWMKWPWPIVPGEAARTGEAGR